MMDGCFRIPKNRTFCEFALTAVLIGISLTSNAVRAPSCLPGWIRAGYGCYKFNVNDKRTWDNSRKACRGVGGDLAVIMTMDTLAHISNALSNTTITAMYLHIRSSDSVTNITKPLREWNLGDCGGFNGYKLWLQTSSACSFLDGFICQNNNIDVAANRPTNSSTDILAASYLAVDGIKSTCFCTKHVQNPWWLVELEKEMYVHKILVQSGRNCCSIPSSYMEALVKTNTHVLQRIQRCGKVNYKGKEDLTDFMFVCSPPIRGLQVIIRLPGSNASLVLCKVSVVAFASVESARGTHRDIFYRLINSQGLGSIKYSPAFRTRPQGSTVSSTFAIPWEVSDNYGEVVTTYLQPPSSGRYKFRLSCDDECELWIGTYSEPGFLVKHKKSQLKIHATMRIIAIRRWAGPYNDSIGCMTETSQPYYLGRSQFYSLFVIMKGSRSFQPLRVGMQLGQQWEEPIRNRNIFAVKPGFRTLVFRLHGKEAPLKAEIGSTITINATYKFCCSGLYCPETPLVLELQVFNQKRLVSSSLHHTCQEWQSSTLFEVTFVFQPGVYEIKLFYTFVNESRRINGMRQVGQIEVQVVVLVNLHFNSGTLYPWSSTDWKVGIPQEYTNNNGSFAYIDVPKSKAELPTPTVPWKGIYYRVGCLQFRYLMPSLKSPSTLKVYLNRSDQATLLWRLSGYQGNKWLRASVPWRPTREAKVVFIGETKANGSVSLAVDDIKITTEACTFAPLYASVDFSCPSKEFTCANDHCISKSQRCDGDYNCLDQSDETGCHCLTSELTCSSGRCVPSVKICDGHQDCEDGLDELRCDGQCAGKFSCPDGKCIPWSSTCNDEIPLERRCQDGADQPILCGLNWCPLNNLNCKDTAKLNSSTCSSLFKGRCDFENSFCGLKHDNSTALRWEIATGKTPSADTGPTYDHSTLSERGSFIFIEASQQPQGAKARLQSDRMAPNEKVCLQFWYHMYGEHIGSLNIITRSEDGEEIIVWAMSGNRGNSWRIGQVELSSKKEFKFVIEGIRGSGNKGDIAVDDVTLLKGGCEKIPDKIPLDCSFESTCHWTQKGDWQLSVQNSSHHLVSSVSSPFRGGFIYLMKSGFPSLLLSPVFPPNVWRCMRFWYTIYCNYLFCYKTEIKILGYRKHEYKPVLLGSRRERTQGWSYVQISFEKFKQIVQIVLEAHVINTAQANIAIDDITFSETFCDTIPWSSYTGFLLPPRPKCSQSLGMQNFKIPDSAIRVHNHLNHEMGRLYLPGGWCFYVSNESAVPKPYLQVDLGKISLVTRVATQGSPRWKSWVTKYGLQFALNNTTWRSKTVYRGNTDEHTVVFRYIVPPVKARYIRLYPLELSFHPLPGCLRVDFFGCTSSEVGRANCDQALGIQNGQVTDLSFTSSSSQGAVHRARLLTAEEWQKPGAWVPAVAEPNQWLQIDFGGVAMVTRIATQGRYGNLLAVNHWVTSYSLAYARLRGYTFERYTINGTVMIFPGNIDGDSVVYNRVDPPLVGRYVRIHPETWHSHPALRLEMYGCLAGLCSSIDDALCSWRDATWHGYDTIDPLKALQVNSKGIQIESLGCYKDLRSKPAIPSLDGVQYIEDYYGQRAGAILRCAQAANTRGFSVFAIQDGGKCMSGNRAEVTYNKYGPSTSCAAESGRGGLEANDVYRIHRHCDWGDSLCSWEATAWKYLAAIELRGAFESFNASSEGYFLQLSNESAMLSLPHQIATRTNGFTVCYWVQCQTSAYSLIIHDEFKRNSTPLFAVKQEGCDYRIVVLEKEATAEVCTCDGSWHHVCVYWNYRANFQYKKTAWEVYLNGKAHAFGRWYHKSQKTYHVVLYSRISIHHVPMGQSNATMRFTDLNAWNLLDKSVLRMSDGCGGASGDLITWAALTKTLSGDPKLREGRSCAIARGGMAYSSMNSSYKNSFESPWLNRSGWHYEKCMEFRYIAYGLGRASLVIYQTLEGDKMGERSIWKQPVSQKMEWQYGLVAIGAVGKHKISVRGEHRRNGRFLFAISGVHFKAYDHYCRTTPSSAASRACSMNMTSSSGLITSPYYPGYYPRNTTCVWQINTSQSHVIRITIKVFQLKVSKRCEDDYLEVHDGIPRISKKTALIGRYCGSSFPPVIETTTNAAYVVFRSINSNRSVDKGFELHYQAKEIKGTNTCRQGNCPVGCRCYLSSGDKSRLIVEGKSLMAIPNDIPRDTSAIMFSGGRITQIKKGDFRSFIGLEYIDLSRNIILRIEDGGFTDLPLLQNLKLTSNFIQIIGSSTFENLGRLETLDISENLLSSVEENAFHSLKSLTTLSLRQNKIKVLPSRIFSNSSNLTYVYLHGNVIEKIPNGLFAKLGSLKTLYLHDNMIEKIPNGLFAELGNLETLTIHHNLLREQDIPQDIFSGLKSLRYLRLDSFILCCYAKQTIPGVRCDSSSNQFSSCEDMLKESTVRLCIWFLGILACAGNVAVVACWIATLLQRPKSHTRRARSMKADIQSFMVVNLACADLLMGVYLLSVASHDVMWRGEYFRYDVQWRSGLPCQIAGAIATLSGEVSVMILIAITADRVNSMLFDFPVRVLTMNIARIICALIWAVGTIIAFVPLWAHGYFQDQASGCSFYGRSTVCLPLQLSANRPAGWEYSVGVFIVFNGLAFLFILISYVGIYIKVRKSSQAVRTNTRSDSALAKRVLFLILTDFCCWMPVIVLGVLSLTGNFNDPSGKTYAWIAVFVLPVNSSINPFLYTFCTPNFKQKARKLLAMAGGNRLTPVGQDKGVYVLNPSNKRATNEASDKRLVAQTVTSKTE